MNELMADGLVSAASAVALVACPALLLFWCARGFASMGVGICAEAAPMFFGLSLVVMLAEAAALVYVLGQNLKAAGYDLEKARYHAERALYRAKDLAVDLSRNGYSYLMRASEMIVPAIRRVLAALTEAAQNLYANRPQWMSAAHWAGPEGSYLLR